MELMPERCGAGQSRDFELVLSKVCIAANRFCHIGTISIIDVKFVGCDETRVYKIY
jgi:hypothetical protein